MITGLYGAAVAILAAIILREPSRNISKKEILEVEDIAGRNNPEFHRIST